MAFAGTASRLRLHVTQVWFGPGLNEAYKDLLWGGGLVFDVSSPHTQHHMFLVDGLRVRQGKWDTRSIREQQIHSAQMTPCLEQFLRLYGQNDDQRIYSTVRGSFTRPSGFTVWENGLHVLWKSCTLTESCDAREIVFYTPHLHHHSTDC